MGLLTMNAYVNSYKNKYGIKNVLVLPEIMKYHWIFFVNSSVYYMNLRKDAYLFLFERIGSVNLL